MAWKLYTNAACTTVFGGTLNLTHFSDFTDNPQDFVFYYAEVEQDVADNGSLVLQAASDPGVDNIVLTVVDSDVGSGHEASEIKLATTLLGLDTATGGATLSLGTQLTSGVTQRQEIHLRVTNAVTASGVSTELSVSRNAVVEVTV